MWTSMAVFYVFWGEKSDNGVSLYPSLIDLAAYDMTVSPNDRNSVIPHSKIYTRWVKTDFIIGFVAPENIENDQTCQNFRSLAKNNFSDFY